MTMRLLLALSAAGFCAIAVPSQGLLVNERLLQRMRTLGTAESLERGNTVPGHAAHLGDAGWDGTTSHKDRAATALAEPAAESDDSVLDGTVGGFSPPAHAGRVTFSR